jgi:hypothetical protein
VIRETLLSCLLTRYCLGLLLILPISSLAGTDTGLSESLRQALEAQGWRAEQAQDGSIIYRKPAAPISTGHSQPSTKSPQREAVQDALKQRGWQMEWSPSGSLILRPQGEAASVPEQSEAPAAVRSVEPIPDLPGFQYWRIEKQADGSVNFHPLGQVPDPSQSAPKATLPGRCVGSDVRVARLSLPVNSWSEAKALAQAWLQQENLAQGLLIGKIRRVLGIYLVSLVDPTPPYFLKHQLAIRASDGRVMLLE